MRYKKIILLSLLLLSMLALGTVSASDDLNSNSSSVIGDTNSERLALDNDCNVFSIESKNANNNDTLGKNLDNSDVLSVDDGDYFKKKVSNTPSGGTLVLDKDYNLDSCSIIISKPITIDGAGHKLSTKKISKNYFIQVNANNVVLRNIVFSNMDLEGDMIKWVGNKGKIESCTFSNNDLTSLVEHHGEYERKNIIHWTGQQGVIHNSKFFNNRGGIAIFLINSNNQVSKCNFNNNKYMYCIYMGYDMNGCSIANCIFNNNEYNNGIIYNQADKTIIKNSRFTNNKGVAIYFDDPFYRQSSQGTYGANSKIVGSIFINNIASYDDGGVIVCKAKSCGIKDSIIFNSVKNEGSFITSWDTEFDANYNWWGNTLKNESTKPYSQYNVKVDHWLFLNEKNYLKMNVPTIKSCLYDYFLNEYDDAVIKKYQSSYLPSVKLTQSSFKGSTIVNIALDFNKILLTMKSVVIKKSAKSLVFTATLKTGKAPIKSKYVVFKFNGKNYKVKTNSKGVAKYTIKQNILKKLKVGKIIKYQVNYGKIIAKKSAKVKK